MLDSKKLLELGNEIVVNIFPEEELVFNEFGEDIVEEALQNEEKRDSEEEVLFEFGESVETILNITIVLVNLATAIVQLRSSKQSNKIKETSITDQFIDRLRSEKMKEDKIDQVVELIKPRLKSLLND